MPLICVFILGIFAGGLGVACVLCGCYELSDAEQREHKHHYKYSYSDLLNAWNNGWRNQPPPPPPPS
jgi:hypothetical protein